MKTKTMLGALKLVVSLLGLMCVISGVGLTYVLYLAVGGEVPWTACLWPIIVGVVVRHSADTVEIAARRLDYVARVVRRGYTQEEAVAAWHTASQGGSNLLFRLQFEELKRNREVLT